MSNSIDQLEKLESLRRSGAIDENEFEILKHSILNETPAFKSTGIETENYNIDLNNNVFDKNQKIALAGSGILLIGIFCPLISAPLLGSVNYFQNGQGDGIIILVLAIVTAAAALANRVRLVLFTGLGALAVMLISFIVFQFHIDKMQKEIEKELAGGPLQDLSDVAMNTVQLQWGCAVLLLGAAVIVYAGWSARDVNEI